MQAAYLDTTRRARPSIIAAVLMSLALALLTAAPLAADTVTTGTASWGWSGTTSTSRDNACNGAQNAAESDANCSSGTLTMTACQCLEVQSGGDGGAAMGTECSVDWTCTIEEEDTDT